MATKNAAENAASAPTAKYLLSKLAANSEKVFGVSGCTFAGATAELAEGEYSIDEISAIIKEWQKKEAK